MWLDEVEEITVHIFVFQLQVLLWDFYKPLKASQITAVRGELVPLSLPRLKNSKGKCGNSPLSLPSW